MAVPRLGATGIAAATLSGALSPVAVVEALLTQIAAHEERIHAFTRLDTEGALAAARRLATEGPRGRLYGVPVGVKDIIDVAGLPTTCHSRVLPDSVARADAACVARLRAEGAIILGKLSTHEFAIGGPSFDLPWPPARNPWDTARHPGGSSSGSGAGLAAGFFPLALGTDTGGSVRNPATACGVVGLKPTYGLVSRQGVFPLAWSLDHVGPMARRVADAALLLDVMADPAQPAPGALAATDRGIAGLRVGFVRHFHEADLPATAEVTAALAEAAEVLRGLGAAVEDAVLPPLGAFAAANRVILNAEAWAVHAPWLRVRPEAYGGSARRRLMPGAFLSAEDLLTAQRRRGDLRAATEAVLARFDVLLCASAMEPACAIDDAAELARSYPRHARMAFNLTGHPAVSVMAGLSGERLPIGMQIVGRHFDDATVLRVAAAFERATPWHALVPDGMLRHGESAAAG
jgi:aspartyl-tRNA(Asn)/glutamyl-tRNA(Gln) amidotransferase subunit A